MFKVRRISEKIRCPMVDKNVGMMTCGRCIHYFGSFYPTKGKDSFGEVECLYGLSYFDRNLIITTQISVSELPDVCQPIDVPACRWCDKFTTDKCKALSRTR